jgi:hypothetical protein
VRHFSRVAWPELKQRLRVDSNVSHATNRGDFNKLLIFWRSQNLVRLGVDYKVLGLQSSGCPVRSFERK